MTNFEFSNEYEYEYIQDVNFGTNTNIFACWDLVEYEYEYCNYLNIRIFDSNHQIFEYLSNK